MYDDDAAATVQAVHDRCVCVFYACTNKFHFFLVFWVCYGTFNSYCNDLVTRADYAKYENVLNFLFCFYRKVYRIRIQMYNKFFFSLIKNNK